MRPVRVGHKICLQGIYGNFVTKELIGCDYIRGVCSFAIIICIPCWTKILVITDLKMTEQETAMTQQLITQYMDCEGWLEARPVVLTFAHCYTYHATLQTS
jgi:hypothetical protein